MEPLSADDPRRIGTYQVIGRLGKGGMGRVYLGRSAGGRTVAIKVVHPHFAADEAFRARFAREVAAARLVGGDWTAPVLDADPAADVPWVATGYVAGPDLHGAVQAHGPLPRRGVMALGAGLAEALAAVHARGLVHRDVKPSNVLLSLEGPRLIDFGIARASEATAQLTATGVTVGSPGYMAPEQVVGGQVGPASDVFSFGAVLAYAAGGRAPFPGDTPAQLLYQVVHEEPRLDGVPEWLRGLVTACLAKDAAARPAPREVAVACAGEGGAAALVAPGWLPQPVVEDVSRRAVALLNLEATAPPPAPGQYPTPPPTPTPTPTPTSAPTPPPVTQPSTPYGPPVPAAGPYATQPGDGPPPWPTPPYVTRSATPSPAPPRRSRRWLIVPAAAVAVAALVAAAFLTGLVGGSDEEGGSGGTGGSGGNGGDGEGTVPEEFIGSWSGDIRIGGMAMGPLDVTLEQGAVGEEVGTVQSSDVMGLSQCVDRLTLTEAGADELTFDSLIDQEESRGGDGVCNQEPGRVTLTIDEQGVMHYRSDELEGDLHQLR
ncbi:serine/threonine-protein kinase [Streptomyces johnsoniae]|uniref:Serine/threonine-protein kinase n=1 Tax=Streptomyces johnsoniae TaxID=3075532 RepID=A0ABU2S2Z7_9ACTN|nr:serine/threonine-protein kinase [Streptomyces sp. DSM 41886]MDT0443361.1 serine/threonine-protein kinase [Streptomyces sp. DSM 41886]